MKSRWSDRDAERFLSLWAEEWGEDLALRTYTARLLGSERSLVLHGGGNSSVKGTKLTVLGDTVEALFVKGSGLDMSRIEPDGHPALDLSYLRRLRGLSGLTDEEMVNELRTHLFDHKAPNPSIETLVHAFLPPKFIDHTHADAILALTNQPDGRELIREALGDDVIILDYVFPGFALAKVSAEAHDAEPGKRGFVWLHHGLVTWGETARESYERTIELVSRAESYLDTRAGRALRAARSTSIDTAFGRWARVGPVLRGRLAEPPKEDDSTPRRVILTPLITREVLDIVDSDRGKELALSPPLTSDHLIRTKAFPLWLDAPAYDDAQRLRTQIERSLAEYAANYEAYLNRNARIMPKGTAAFAPQPRVILMPGLGCVCVGENIDAANIVRDITAQTLEVKSKVAAMGSYEGLSERHLFEMEYRALQHAKLDRPRGLLRRHVAVVTGAAGAIGSGISRVLLEQGCHVAVTDLPGERLDEFVEELGSEFGARVLGVPLDVTDPASVAGAFTKTIQTWGGVDLVVVNAGDALVAPLAELRLEAFRRLERINVEGTLTLLAEAARHFASQGTGGDVVLISTKNVFSPGAKFGAYSATKAAAHQLARIASLELAEIGVRVNMVAPDAVFSEGTRKSGLWEKVGPDRMRARGLTEEGLEDYYRDRNLLKTKVTATHVANAVLFFATRQTPTTGATIPVDGGLPDATPR